MDECHTRARDALGRLGYIQDKISPGRCAPNDPGARGRSAPVTLRRPGARRDSTPIRRSTGPLPRVIEPMLATPTEEAFDSAAHIFEVLWDGVRARSRSSRARTCGCKTDSAATSHTDTPNSAPSRLGCAKAASPSTERLWRSTSRAAPISTACTRDWQSTTATRRVHVAATSPVTFQAFDLLYREGQPVFGWSLRRRKEMLGTIVRPDATIATPDWVCPDGVDFFEAARGGNLEGIVAKEIESRYLQVSAADQWLTVRVYRKDEFVIGGYTFGGRWNEMHGKKPAQEPFSSLLLGQFGNDGRLRYVGEVTGGFRPDDMDGLKQHLDEMTTTDSPFADEPELGRLVFWCKPWELAATVRYAEMTPGRPPPLRCLRSAAHRHPGRKLPRDRGRGLMFDNSFTWWLINFGISAAWIGGSLMTGNYFLAIGGILCIGMMMLGRSAGRQGSKEGTFQTDPDEESPDDGIADSIPRMSVSPDAASSSAARSCLTRGCLPRGRRPVRCGRRR